MTRVAVACALAALLSGCASGHSDWFRIYEARAAVDALREGPAASSAPGEVERVRALLDQAESALVDGRRDDVAQIAELALLRARIVSVGAAAEAGENDVADAEVALAGASRDTEVATEQLRQAKSELERLSER
ncbi:MAG: DUF4398 domain-containing protein [Candidatus Poribacteria bacterium]